MFLVKEGDFMSEEQTKQLSSRGKSRRERVEFARSRDILDVANELNMDLVRSGRDYRWKDHDSFVITPSKNLWKWYSRNQGGDVISLVEVMKEVGFNQAIDYLNDGRFKEFTTVEQVREEFSYYLKPYEQPFNAARSYLKDKRGLSDETIDFFLDQDVLAQANAKVNDSIEPVVVFKSFDFSGEIVGATLQGIEENWDKWPERGYAKNIVRNSDGITGMHVDVGQPNRLIFAESAIDLMSYYELHKDNLQDVRLISMDGLKESVIGRHLSQLLLEVSGRPIGKTHEQLAESLQTAIDHDFFSDGKNADLITLAVDNDEGGRNFIQSLQEKGAAVTPDLPTLEPGKEKTDWNDLLQREKTVQQSALKEEKETKPDNSRLAQAERKLERLKGELDTRANSVYAHTRQTNGQPMNDKRNGAAFFRKQEQLEGAVFATLDDIKKQEERVEKLRHQQDLKERGFNKQGSGLEMSVQNIPRIKEELEKAERGESFFTRETLKRYRQELVKLEAMKDRLETTQTSPGAQQLIDEGLVNQWQKQPTLYFVKGLRKVALELTKEGEFQPSQKYLAKDTEAVDKVSELLELQASVNNEQVQNIELEPESVSLEQATEPKFEKEHLSTVARKDLPINIQKSERLQELLGQVEELGQNAYFWVTEEDLGQPKEAVTQLDNWFSSGKVDSTYKSDLFELVVGDYTYMIEFRDGSLSLQNMEEYAQYLSSRIEKLGSDTVALELESVIGDFNQMKESITEAVDKELEVITVNRNSLSEEPQKPKEKPLEINNQEGDFNSEQHKKNETKIRDLSEQAHEAAPLPEATQSQPLKDLSPSQSESHSLLHFTIKNPQKSIYKDKYHPIKPDELSKLNHHASNIQNAAKWYLDNLSDTTLHYFYQQGDKQYNINIDFEQYHFMHLTGLFPIKNGQTAIKTLHDFAAGRGDYDNIMIADKEAAFQKIKVLPDLRAIMETDSFYFDQVEDIPKLHSLSLEHAIKSDDKDILLAFSSNNENIYPASLMELTDELKIQTEMSQHQNVILGIYQERDGEITQLSVNENFIKDNGEEMFSVLKNKKYRAPSAEESPKRDESYPPNETVKITPEAFTQVVDTVYNVGSPHDLSNVPEEFQGAWKHYFELSEVSKGDFKHVIDKAVQEGLVLTESSFYQEWIQDRIYNENYHVRIQQVDNWPDGVNQPFNSGDLRAYEEFVTSLYKGNQVLGDSLTEATKITFDIYAPGGQLIKDKVSYDMGVETEPVSRLLGLGYRRLEGQPELAQIDEAVLSQLENQKVNQEIAIEANEPVVVYKEVPKENSPKQDPFTSPKQEMKAILDRQVEKIVAEDMANPVPQIEEARQFQIEAEFDYKTASAYEISEMAFQKIREYTQSPEALAEYVEFMSKFPQLSPRNVALIQAQWPGANAVATYDQWQAMGEVLGIDSSDVIQTKKVYTNKRTGETKEVTHQGLSVKTGEKAQITLFRPLITKMIPVLDAQGNQLKNDKGNPKYKKLSQATPQEKALVKEGKLQVKQFQERDLDTGVPRFTTYKVFELSQTTLKPESYPKAMPNRHFDFNTDQIKTKEVLDGLCDYAKTIGVTILQDDAHKLGNIKGAFYPGKQLILLNSDNTPGEKIATTIHELAHATLHNPSLTDSYQAGLPKNQKELEAEMTSHLVSKHFGLDTSEKAFDYLAKWTKNLTALDDQQLTQSFKRIHKTVSKLVKHVEAHTKPYQVRKQRGMQPNFSQAPKKGPSR